MAGAAAQKATNSWINKNLHILSRLRNQYEAVIYLRRQKKKIKIFVSVLNCLIESVTVVLHEKETQYMYSSLKFYRLSISRTDLHPLKQGVPMTVCHYSLHQYYASLHALWLTVTIHMCCTNRTWTCIDLWDAKEFENQIRSTSLQGQQIRRLKYVRGMLANMRFACSGWERLGTFAGRSVCRGPERSFNV